jgi:hypothetical protein
MSKGLTHRSRIQEAEVMMSEGLSVPKCGAVAAPAPAPAPAPAYQELTS